MIIVENILKKLFLILVIFILQYGKVFAYCNEQVSYIVVDGKNGNILEQNNDKNLKHPASLTKIMTLYLAFEALEKGEITMDTEIEVSDRVACQPKFNADLKEGDTITVRDAILGIIVKSFNDFAVALAEAIDDNEWNFVRKMNQKAVELGLDNTYFKNCTGFSNDNQQTTAFDIARLVFKIKHDFPEYYSLFSTKSFKFKDKEYETHNHVLTGYKYAEGLKTGFTKASGYNLATTAHKNNKDLIGIIISCSNLKERDAFMISILDSNFEKNIENDVMAQNKANSIDNSDG